MDERQNVALAIGQRLDRLVEEGCLLARKKGMVRVVGAGGGPDRLAELTSVLVAGGRVEREDMAPIELDAALAQLGDADLQLCGQFLLVGLASRLREPLVPGAF